MKKGSLSLLKDPLCAWLNFYLLGGIDILGAIEAGGTKFVCAVGDVEGKVLGRIQIPTTIPEETMPGVIAFFQQYEIDSIGVGSFGPIDVNQESATYGHITSTPKPG